MAAKNKQRKKSKKVTFEAEENEPEAKNSGGEEDEGEEKNTKEEEREEEELSLEEVLRLGGTKVILPGETGPTLTESGSVLTCAGRFVFIVFWTDTKVYVT